MKINLPRFLSGFLSTDKLNSLAEDVEAGFENTLSRDGSLPNQMEADLDMNNKQLLNVNRIDSIDYYKGGLPLEMSVSYANKLYQLFSGTGAQVDFILTQNPGSLGNLEVSVAGVVKRPSLDYTFTGTTLHFLVAPASGTNNILVRYDQALIGTSDSSALAYTPPQTGVPGSVASFLDSLWTAAAGTGAALIRFLQSGSGANARTVQAKLREIRSPDDYGAVGDGTTDDKAAIAYADLAGPFVFVAGKTYRVSSNLTLSNAVRFEPGAKLSIDSGITVTFNGPLIAGLQQIFSGVGNAAGFSNVRVLYPEWWGADPITSVDSTTAVQKAFNAAAGLKVVLSGTYKISAKLTITNAITVEGTSYLYSGFLTTTTTQDILEIALGTNIITDVVLRRFTIDATSVRSSGYGIAVSASSGGMLYDGWFDQIRLGSNMAGGVYVAACHYLRINEVDVIKVGANSAGFVFRGVDSVSKAANIWMSNSRVRSGTSGTTYGLLIDSYSEGMYINRCSFESSLLTHGVMIDNTMAAPRAPENLWFNTVICDDNGSHGWNLVAALCVKMTDCWSTSCTNDGVRLGAATDIEIRGHSSIANGQYGIEIKNTCKQVRIFGGIVDANSQAASNTYDGIGVEANTTDFTIKDVDFFRTGSTKAHRYDVAVVAGTSDRYIVKNNRCRGGLTGTVSDGGSGSNKFVNENIT